MLDNLSEVKEAIANWQTERLVGIEPSEFHTVYKLGFEVEYYREAAIYRLIDLLKPAISLTESSDFLGAIILARSAQETVSVLFHVNQLIEFSLENKDVQKLKNDLKRLILGCSNNPPLPEKINILTLVDKVDKLVPGFRKKYDSLSEYAHPNWAGTLGIFAKPIPTQFHVDFGRYIRGENGLKLILESSICSSAMFHQYCQNKYDQISKPFIDLCIELHEKSELYPTSNHPEM